MQSTDWWQTFFSGVVLDFWRGAVPPEQTRAEADFLQRVLEAPDKGRILDVPCGTGRLTLALASRGYRTTGVDIAEPYVHDATAQAKQQNIPAEFHRRDMRELPWAGEFDAAFCVGNSFGYMDDESNTAFLKTVARCLKSGARFVLDIGFVAECLLPAFHEKRWFKIGDIYFLSQAKYDCARSRIETEYTFIRDGQVEVKPTSSRIYTYRELCDIMIMAGFTELQPAGGLQGEEFKLGASRLVLTAKKAS
jgi:SAM-dependent methyltransferase